MAGATELMAARHIEERILFVRRHRVLLDQDLANLYGVPVRVLNQAVKRNPRRFPSDFVFRLTQNEAGAMRSQFVTASKRNVRYLPYAFTEHGAIMAANVLNSPRAVETSVLVVRAFVRLRQILATHRKLAEKMAELERRLGSHDEAIGQLVAVIRELMEPPAEPPRERIGFHPRRALPKGH
ncbi:MAG: ORF6N domain-containing protein [Planctomycetota bacterium]|nr:ORF6N domain-containing protein [Planctomycetota bacterium]